MKRITKGHIFSFILGAIIFSSVTALAVTLVGKNITYDNTNSGLASTNVQDAVDELEEKFEISCNLNSVSAWLKTANINKNYTTLSQVLNDSETLQALMNNNNAVDYLAKSTGWANTISNDERAMTYIGASNYCANKLVNIEEWALAFAKSHFVSKVWTITVPTMTSNTAPSGVASSSSVNSNSNSYQAYHAFSDDTSIWHSSWGTNFAEQWVQYKFPNPVNIRAFKYTYGVNSNSVENGWTYKISASNDGVNFVDLGSYSISGYTKPATTDPVLHDVFKMLDNTQSYTYYRYTGTSPQQVVHHGIMVWRLQFYGRAAN